MTRIDQHYIYVNGVVNPRDPESSHALSAGNDYSIWLNAQGKRFTNETGFDKEILVDLLQQEPSTYWAIFDETTRDDFNLRGAAWLKNPKQGHPILDNPKTAAQAESLSELAGMTGLPVAALVHSVARFNAMIEAGEDSDFGRFSGTDKPPPRIAQPPFYAVQMYPVTRKSMGGVAIDRQARALDHRGEVFPGLYAVGELNGSVGINGKHGLDGMFLGPAILTGRLAGRSISAAYGMQNLDTGFATPLPLLDDNSWDDDNWKAQLSAQDLVTLLIKSRDGYWHFQMSHQLVLEWEYDCLLCHSAQLPFSPLTDRQSILAQTRMCTNCH
jgi:hypothetical protein